MSPIKYLLQAVILCCLCTGLNAQPINPSRLDDKQQAVVTISAFAAKGDLLALRLALIQGLDAGLTVSETKEILVQLYAYAGFPRSLNGLQTLMDVLKERKHKGIKDEPGRMPSPLPTGKNRQQFGTEMQTKLIGQPVKGALFEFAPAIDQFLKEHLFGDILGRDNLDWKTRELATIAALAALGNVESQLRTHLAIGKHNGLTEEQLSELASLIQLKIGKPEGESARQSLQMVFHPGQPIQAAADSNTTGKKSGLMIRIAEIEIQADKLDAYKAILIEESEAFIRLEPGVISIFPLYQNTNPAQIKILEIYASKEAYQSHLKTPHFQKYKTSTSDMVKSLKMIEMEAVDAAMMPGIFSKLKQEN